MFISRIRAKGTIYFYIYAYDSSAKNGMKIVYRMGRKEKALNKLKFWRDQQDLPEELIELGLKKDDLETWRKKIESIE